MLLWSEVNLQVSNEIIGHVLENTLYRLQRPKGQKLHWIITYDQHNFRLHYYIHKDRHDLYITAIALRDPGSPTIKKISITIVRMKIFFIIFFNFPYFFTNKNFSYRIDGIFSPREILFSKIILSKVFYRQVISSWKKWS